MDYHFVVFVLSFSSVLGFRIVGNPFGFGLKVYHLW